MRSYELIVLLHPDLEIDVDNPLKKITKLVENAHGKVVKSDNWGKRRTAYKVNKQDFAVYVQFDLMLEPSQVRSIENGLLITEEVMRHLMIAKPASRPKAPEKKAKPKAESEEAVKTDTKKEEEAK